MVDVQTLKKTLLAGKKSERIIFAVTPDMKDAVAKLAAENCMTMSAYITSLLVEDALDRHEELER